MGESRGHLSSAKEHRMKMRRKKEFIPQYDWIAKRERLQKQIQIK